MLFHFAISPSDALPTVLVVDIDRAKAGSAEDVVGKSVAKRSSPEWSIPTNRPRDDCNRD